MLDPNFIRNIIENDIADGIIHGGVVLAGTPEAPFCELELGHATAAHDTPMTLDTVIDGASTTKVVAGITSLLILRDRGLIDFDRPFTDYLPEYTAPHKETITVRDLANHLSGFTGGSPVELSQNPIRGKELLRLLLTTPPKNSKTTVATYSCWNYHLLAQIIEKVSGRRLADFCQDEIFTPLAMNDTSLGKPRADIPQERLAQTFGTPQPGMISDPPAARLWGDGVSTANAGLFCTAHDYAKLLRCYLRNGSPIFTPESAAECAPDKQEDFEGYRRFGWVIASQYIRPESFGCSLHHSGWSGQTIYLDYKRNIYIVVLTARCGDYERAKHDRFDIIGHIVQNY